MISAFASGFFLGGSLIIAIGAQNAFLLRQGLLREHVFILCLICATSDALLIAAGVAGLGAFVERYPNILNAILWGGAAFLIAYAIFALRRALAPEALEATKEKTTSLKAAIGVCLALTFLNPHVYLDTVLLVGGISTKYRRYKACFRHWGCLSIFCMVFLTWLWRKAFAAYFCKTYGLARA